MKGEHPAHKVLLVGWDAADWKIIRPLMAAGKLPTLAKLAREGVTAKLATLHPVLSPLLWTSVATGKRPFKHGVLGFTEPAPDGTGVRPATNLSRKVKAVWNILNQTNHRSHVVGWWPSHPAEPINGAMVSNYYQQVVGPLDQPWPVPPGTIHPRRLEETLSELRFHPAELVAEQILPFIPRAAEIDQDRDPRLAIVAGTLAECTSIHGAATWLLQNEPWDFMAVYYDAIDRFCHCFMKYHRSRRGFVHPHDGKLYRGVVEAGYRYHDLMLQRLLTLASEDTTVIVVSDHGFHSDHLRPHAIPDDPAGPAVEHRDLGILAMKGPGIKKDERVRGVSILDITPTVLTLFGLPVAGDMDGRPLVEAFEEPPPVTTIPSWEAMDGEDGRHPADERIDPLVFPEAINQLVALGYIEPPEPERKRAVATSVGELRYNLARSYMDADLHAHALAILEELRRTEPGEHRFAIQLAVCYRALNRISELRRLVAEMTADRGEADDPFQRDYLLGFADTAAGRHEAALRHLRRAEKVEPKHCGLHVQIGEACLKLKRWKDAQRAFVAAVRIDVDHPHAHLGLCRSYLSSRENKRAAAEALTTVGLFYHYPLAHFFLGIALHRLGCIAPAMQAFRVAITLNPNFLEPHERLAHLYERRLGEAKKAMAHSRLAEAIRMGRPVRAAPSGSPEARSDRAEGTSRGGRPGARWTQQATTLGRNMDQRLQAYSQAAAATLSLRRPCEGPKALTSTGAFRAALVASRSADSLRGSYGVKKLSSATGSASTDSTKQGRGAAFFDRHLQARFEWLRLDFGTRGGMAERPQASGLALLATGATGILAGRRSITLNVDFLDAHEALARIHERRLRDPDGAAAHRRLVEEIRTGRDR